MLRVGHDRRRVAVDEDDAVALLAQRLAGLGAGVVELAGLADDDRAGADDEDGFQVGALRHGFSRGPSQGRKLPLGGRAAPEVRACHFLRHQRSETVEQVADVVRPGAGLGVTLEAEGRAVGARQALQRAVEQRHMRRTQVGRQRRLVHREAVVLAGDGDAAGVQVLHRVVGPVMAELHLEGPRTRGQRQDLVAQADAEGGDAGVDQLPGRPDGVVAGLGVTGAVGQEDAVWLQRQHLLRPRCAPAPP